MQNKWLVYFLSATNHPIRDKQVVKVHVIGKREKPQIGGAYNTARGGWGGCTLI